MFLTEQEKIYVGSTLALDSLSQEELEDDHSSWAEVIKAFASPQCLLFYVIGLVSGSSSNMQIFNPPNLVISLAGTISYGMAYFEPSIVAGLGNFGPVRAQLMSVPPFAVAFLCEYGVL
jgi:hypothetical protein